MKCLEAVIRAHERVDCQAVTSLKKQLVEADAENARLKAEVERLTKAALLVYLELDEFGQVSAKSVHELRDAAKGVQS